MTFAQKLEAAKKERALNAEPNFGEQKDRGAWSKSAIDKPESEDQFCPIALTNSPSGSKKHIPLFF